MIDFIALIDSEHVFKIVLHFEVFCLNLTRDLSRYQGQISKNKTNMCAHKTHQNAWQENNSQLKSF